MSRMKVCVQAWTPHDQSLLYELSHLYWQQRGLMAWLSGEVPHRITSSRALASGLAQVLVAHVGELEGAGRLSPAQPLAVLEIGGGLGTFAAQLLSALEEDCGEEGRALLGRLRYIFSDFAPRTVLDALQTDALAPWAARGVVQGARFDMRAPDQWEPLAGEGQGEVRGWDGVPLLGVFANYICCVAGSKVFQRRVGSGWHELAIQVVAELPQGSLPEAQPEAEKAAAVLENIRQRTGALKVAFDFQERWQPVALAGSFGADRPHHAPLAEAIVGALDEATLVYPLVYIDCVRALSEHLLPGGFVMTSDYGSADPHNMAGLQDHISQTYGNTVNYGVNFEVLRALARLTPGWSLLMTRDTLRSMHHALLVRGESPGPRVRAAFHSALDDAQRGEALLEFTAAAMALYEKQDHVGAARLYRRCIDLDPTELLFYERAGLAALEAACLQDALGFFARGHAADPEGMRDFPFHMARCLAIMHQWPESARWYRQAIAQKPHPTKWTNLAGVLRRMGQHQEALDAANAAIALSPDYKRAWQLKAELEVALGLAEDLRWTDPDDPDDPTDDPSDGTAEAL